jgi:predicted nucleic acid-binding protein
LIKQAIDICAADNISFWDALIVSAAAAAQCKTIWTEDLNHGQLINGVKIENPFL